MSFFKRKSFKSGLPLILFTIGGSFALSSVTEIRYRLKERRDNFGLTPEAKRALAKASTYESDDSSTDKKPPVLSSVANSDEFVKKSFDEFMKFQSKPITEADLNNPEFKEKKARFERKMSKKLTLEEEYRELRKQDLNKWENKRLPRPYEEKDET